MIKTKQKLTGNLNAKQSLSSKLGNAIIYIDPLTQEKSVEPSKSKQIIIPDDGFNGLSKVVVNKIADNYIIPSGEIEIKENGNYDVTDKESVNVNVPINGPDVSSCFLNGVLNYKYDSRCTSQTTPAIATSLTKLPKDLNFGANCSNMFNACINLEDIDDLPSTSNVINMVSMFRYCSKLTSVPEMDTSKVTNMSTMFMGCTGLASIPKLNTSNVTDMSNMFNGCTGLTSIPSLNCSKITNTSNVFGYTKIPLINIGGFLNLGKNYNISSNANNTQYTLNLSYLTDLTEESLINVLNNLYDIAAKGCKAQQVVLGATNLAKLTSAAGQTALSNAQTKGWTIS